MNEQDEGLFRNKEYRNSAEGKRMRYIAHLVVGVFAVCLLLAYLLFQSKQVSNGISWLIGSLRAVLLGLGIGYLLNPLDNTIRSAIARKMAVSGKQSPSKIASRSRALSITLTSLFGIGVVILLLLLIIPSFIDSIENLGSIVSENLEKVTVWVNSHATGDDIFSDIVNRSVDAVQNWINEDLSAYVASLTTTLLSTGMQVVFYILDFLIAFIVAIYTLLEKEHFARRSKKLLYACMRPSYANRILDICRHGNRIFGSFLSGKLLDSLIIGILCFLLMSIFRIPYAVLVSVVIGCTNIIPFLGPFIGGIPCGAIILLASPEKGIVFIIMFLILQQVDGNIIGPMILGDKTGVSAFWIICSLLFFKAVFGLLGTGMSIVGMIIGVPLFCVIDYVVSQRINERLQQKGMNPDDVDFQKIAQYDTEAKRFIPLAPKEMKAPLKERFYKQKEKITTLLRSHTKHKGKKK